MDEWSLGVQDTFWAEEHACADPTDLSLSVGECVAHTGCTADTRYCLYGPDTAHQIPRGFADLVMGWFDEV